MMGDSTEVGPLLGAAMQKAAAELQTKTIEDVQRATAITWGGRALAAYALFEQTGDVRRLCDAEEFAHESMEHGSLAGDPAFSDAIGAHMHAAKARALMAWGPR